MSAGTMRLYEAVDQLALVLLWLDEHEEEIVAGGGEIPPALLELLEAAEGALNDKLERVALVIHNLSAQAKVAKSEADRLAGIAATYQRQADTLKAYAHREMERAGVPKVEGARAKLWIQANGAPSIRPADPDNIPEAFRRVRVEFDGTAARDYLKALNAIPTPDDGEVEIEGLIASRGNHLRIK